jgi:hypothetical protein
MTHFNTEGPSFPSSATVPASSIGPCPCSEEVIPTSNVADTLWVPLDEAVYAWTTLCTRTMHYAALMATGTALHAIAWEQLALRHYHQAQQVRTQFPHFSCPPTAVRHDRTLQALSEALNRWPTVTLWLDQLANSHDDPPDAEVLETIRDLSRQVVEFQQRLWTLSGTIREEEPCPVSLPMKEEAATAAEGGTH